MSDAPPKKAFIHFNISRVKNFFTHNQKKLFFYWTRSDTGTKSTSRLNLF
jgi:hypothetical protein